VIVSYYRRCLPHWLPEEKAIFLTWRLYGSIPVRRRTSVERSESLKISDGEKFKRTERILDGHRFGPIWLKNALIADVVVESLLKAAVELQHYLLHSYSVMPNHVHVLITPKLAVREITRGLKGTTGRGANAILGRCGQPFWQDESFDHWVRDEGQFWRLKRYIERNPVKARLVTRPEDWRWSSAWKAV
jgi:REP element-mobilizing transposase RayT